MAAQNKGPPNAAEEFFDHRMLRPDAISEDRSNLPGPLNWQQYKDIEQFLQTRVCTRLAVKYYNSDKEKPADKATKPVVAKDSHMFILNHADTHSFWHVYFRATVAGCSTPFFAELRGEGEPKEVKMCKIVDKYNGSVDVCEHCWGGIRHPKDGGFFGFLRPLPEGPTDHESSQQADA